MTTTTTTTTTTEEETELRGTATYSPDDNKLRFTPDAKLSKEDCQRIKEAGFGWAPRQKIFVAGRWTPGREDLMIEWCGDIEDEGSTLADRAQIRAERFDNYATRRDKEANQANSRVNQLTDGIPLGQPILIGHHSEKRARKDARRIEDGMRKAIKLWDASEYWSYRAAAALANASYKETPEVRHRRIKGIEADLRSQIASHTPHANVPRILQERWDDNGPDAVKIEHAWCGPKGRGGMWVAVVDLPGIEARTERWKAHYEKRLTYERAMLGDTGAVAAEAFDIKVGGRVRLGNSTEWVAVLRVNRKDGRIVSVTTVARFISVRGIEEVTDYREPTEEEAANIKEARKPLPICNYPGEDFLHMTKAEYDKSVPRWSDFERIGKLKAAPEHGAARVRQTLKPGGSSWQTSYVYLTDRPLKPRPAATAPITIAREFKAIETIPEPEPVSKPAATKQAAYKVLKSALEGRIAVEVVEDLFPTPYELAREMVECADITAGARVLEPSAGLGNILRAIKEYAPDAKATAIDINKTVADNLQFVPNEQVITGDFLEVRDIGPFDRVVMNPPFSKAADITHIKHAATFLKPGGRLVAICANGPRQQAALKDWAEESGGEYRALPEGTFKESGTGVNTAMVIYNSPAAAVIEQAPAAVKSVFTLQFCCTLSAGEQSKNLKRDTNRRQMDMFNDSPEGEQGYMF